MIISASRRTDIPAFYSNWFMNRVYEGYCLVPNPFNRKQIARISLKPADVDALVFWSRNPRPLMPHLKELERLGYRYIFHVTVLGYPRWLDRKNPSLAASIRTFQELSSKIGPDRVIWRYDPIVLTQRIDTQFHLENFRTIASALKGSTNRCIISFLDVYRKIQRRLQRLEDKGANFDAAPDNPATRYADLLKGIYTHSRDNGMELFSCAEECDLTMHGIRDGKCIDESHLREVFGLDMSSKKDPGQRPNCACVVSKDIGIYDTCLFGCQYCYATTSFATAEDNYRRHDPKSASLLPLETSLLANQRAERVRQST